VTQAQRRGNIWMALATLGLLVVVYFVVRPTPHVTPAARDLSTSTEVARVVGPRLVTVAHDSALERKLEVRPVKAERITYPLLTVTASVVARFVGGTASPQDRWQFQNGDVSNGYADWRRGQNEVEHAGKQLDKTRELAAAQVTRATAVFERMKKLAATGTETEKDVAAAHADLIQAQIQTQKDVFELESALNLALRNRAAAERTLVQAGVDPLALETQEQVAIIGAEVPEGRMAVVHLGEACEVTFYALPGRAFAGRVTRVSPTLSPERRTLRVFFRLPDRENALKPGMFADVGLGTDAREAFLVPAEAVIHSGRGDYVFTRSAPGPWRVQDVELGEAHGPVVEVRRGLSAGDEVVGPGAILLKPLLVRVLEG
jgi:cobalt-zinc-cadmium efflux system membrane fusion protein